MVDLHALTERFEQLYQQSPRVFSAPGRVNTEKNFGSSTITWLATASSSAREASMSSKMDAARTRSWRW